MESALLIIEDEPTVARRLRKFFSRSLPVETAGSVAEATHLLRTGQAWSGAVIDVSLPDGCGLDVLDVFRVVEPTAPVLVLTGHCEPALINRAQRQKAEYAVKPAEIENFRAFLELVVAHDGMRVRNIAGLVAAYATRHDLTQAECKILTASACGTRRSALAEKLGLAEDTIKAQTRTLLQKCPGAEDLGDIVFDLWARATK